MARMKTFVVVRCRKCKEEVEISDEREEWRWWTLMGGLEHLQCGGVLIPRIATKIGMRPKIDHKKVWE